jgi:poly-gamma-glutamate capsule biosynthesis protein CapA/YwtB (metallophosphatase superfamily)
MFPNTFTISLTGDVMLGRLIDQLMPEHNTSPHDKASVETFIRAHSVLSNYGPSSPWSTTLPLLTSSSLTLINLETAVTTSHTPWPHKTFNYRMHPANLAPTLHAAGINYTSLANNHILDFGIAGLLETITTLKEANIPFAGAGTTADEACKPAILHLPPCQEPGSYEVYVYSASDHPHDWKTIPGFHFLDYTPSTRSRLRTLLAAGKPALRIFSVHWGPNYAWRPGSDIVSLAHFLIECGVDIVHGHSAHHVQGVEVYKGGVIVYGCGDFVDDYVLNRDFRNDLGALWRVGVREREGERGGLEMDRLEILPTRVEEFGARLLDPADWDWGWVGGRIKMLSAEFGTEVRVGDGGIVVELEIVG